MRKKYSKRLVGTVEYKGKMVSLNDFYNSNSWYRRKYLADHWHSEFAYLIKKYIPIKLSIDTYILRVYYNGRMDIDNVAGMIKLFNDTLKQEGYIIDDSPKYCKGISIDYKEEQLKNSIKIKVIELYEK